MKTMARIHHEERALVLKRKMIFFFIGAIGSLGAFVFAVDMAHTEIARSGLPQILSLLFSDPRMVLVAWQDFTLSIFEQLPAMSIASCLLSVLTFLWSLKYLARDYKMVQHI